VQKSLKSCVIIVNGIGIIRKIGRYKEKQIKSQNVDFYDTILIFLNSMRIQFIFARKLSRKSPRAVG